MGGSWKAWYTNPFSQLFNEPTPLNPTRLLYMNIRFLTSA